MTKVRLSHTDNALIFGAFVIVPIHVLIWQQYYSQDLLYEPFQGHLWFLSGHLFAMSVDEELAKIDAKPFLGKKQI